MDGIGEGAWDVGRVGDQEVVLGGWHGDAAQMSASCKASVPMRSRETWPVIATRGTECICAPRRGHEIGGAGAGGGQADADVASVLHLSCGGVAVGLLVPDKNVSDAGRFKQPAVYRQNGSPRMPNTQSTPSSSSQRT